MKDSIVYIQKHCTKCGAENWTFDFFDQETGRFAVYKITCYKCEEDIILNKNGLFSSFGVERKTVIDALQKLKFNENKQEKKTKVRKKKLEYITADSFFKNSKKTTIAEEVRKQIQKENMKPQLNGGFGDL